MTEDEEIEFLALLEHDDANAVKLDWEAGNLRYKLHAAQRKIYDQVALLPKSVREIVLLCARRFGKSVLVLIWALEDCLRNPGSRVYIVGPELKQTVEIVDEKMSLVAQDAPLGLIRPYMGKRFYRVGQSILILGGFDKPNIGKMKGKEAFNVYTEEACEADSDDFRYGMREVISPLLLHTKGRFAHATTPPKDTDHAFLVDQVPKSKLQGGYFEFTIHDNPLADEEMHKQAIEDSGGADTIAYKRNYLVKVVRDGSLMAIPSFNKQVNVRVFSIPRYANFFIHGDGGGTVDKSVIHLSWWDFEEAALYVWKEKVFEPNTGSDVIAAGMKEFMQEIPQDWEGKIVFDVNGQSTVDYEKLHKVRLRMPNKDEFESAINITEVKCKTGKIIFHPQCVFTILSFETGRLNKQRNDFNRNATLGHCDAIASVNYGWRNADKITNPFPQMFKLAQSQFERPTKQNEKPLIKRF